MSDRHDDELNRFWNELTERGTSDAPDLDTGDAMLVRRLQSLAAASLPGAARERVWRGLLDAYEPNADSTKRPQNGATAIAHTPSVPDNRRAHPRANRPLPRPAPGWMTRPVLRYAAAAVLIIGIVLALDVIRGPDRDHGGAPAIEAPATPSPEASPDDTVLQLTLPATALPTGDKLGAGLAVFTIAPGTWSSWDQTCCPGVLVEHVVTGQYTVRAEVAITVVRADGAAEEIPTRTRVVLNPGDSLVSRDEVGVEAGNMGTEPVTLLSWLLIQGDGTFNSHVRLPLWIELWPQFTGHKLPGWVEGQPGDIREMADIQGPITVNAAPAMIQLQRVTMQDGQAVPIPADGLQFIAPVGPHADKLRQTDNTYRVLGEIGQPVTVYVLTLRQTDP